MSRGRLESPNLDDRKWQDIVDEARALIPEYAPEWTDHNPSDLGITLIELFAWLVEGMIYRLNRVPEKNFIEFLNLLGITRDPATPASTFLTYRLVSGMPPTEVEKGNQAGTPQTGDAEAIVFETDHNRVVLAINLTAALTISIIDAAATHKDVSTRLVDAPLSGLTVKIEGNQKTIIALGFDDATSEDLLLSIKLSRPAEEGHAQVTWRYSRGEREPLSWPEIETVDDGTDSLRRNGDVELAIPEDWTGQNPQSWSDISPESPGDDTDESLFWIGLEIQNQEDKQLEIGLEHILFNSLAATSALTVKGESIGVSDGKPFQAFELANRPVFKSSGAPDPYDHLHIDVREPLVEGGFTKWIPWQRVEDLPEGPGQYFRLEPVTGTVHFGNHEPITAPRGHGSIPPAGSEIRAPEYRYVAGGGNANVPPEAIEIIHTPVTGVISVRNIAPATGGSDEEAVEETKRRAPELLRNRYRAVTVEDYEFLAREATTDVKKVRCLAPRSFTKSDTPQANLIGQPWTFGGLNRATGHIHVIIVPDAPASNPMPTPSEDLLEEVSDYLEERRVVTTLMNITFPRYLPIQVNTEIKVWRQLVQDKIILPEKVRQKVESDVTDFLHPLFGGPEGKGWEVGQSITLSSLFEFIQPDPEIGFISEITLQPGTPVYRPPDRPFVESTPGVWVQVADYELICSGNHAIKVTDV